MATTLKATSRQAAAACLSTAIVAGLFAPGFAGAHEVSAEYEEIAENNPGTREPPGGRNALPEIPTNVRIDSTHNAVVVSWDAGHGHAGSWWRNYRFIGHRLYAVPRWVKRDFFIAEGCPDDFPGCVQRFVPLGNTGFRAGSSDHFEGASYSGTISGLRPSSDYFVGVVAIYSSRSEREITSSSYAKVVSTTAAPEPETPTPPEPETPAPPEPETPAPPEPETPAPPEPETPAPPEPETPTPPEPETPAPPEPETPTPPEPETPAPPEPECRWEHRFSTFPTAGSSGRGVLRITARKKGAQVRITAFDRTDGTALTVRDLGNDRELSSPTVTLGAANTVARFAVAGDAGQHVLIVSHAEHVAGMRAVAATMMRQSGGASQVVHPDVAEHCEPSASTAPETPAPPEPECRWEHRFSTFPTAGSSGRGVLRITARKKGAQVRITAFDRTDGTALTVRDLDNDRELSSPTVTLGAANTVARFAVDGDAGRHVLIVSHAEHVAGMRAVTAMMVRQSGGGTSQVVHPDVAEHCEPSAAPDLVIRNTEALLWTDTFDWRASLVNIGDAAAAPTTVRVYHGARELDTKAIEQELAAGSEWPMSDFITRNRPPAGDQVRICVDPVPGEAAPSRSNNCASATVVRN